MCYATYSVNDEPFYGAVMDEGDGMKMVALSPYFPEWPTLTDVVRSGGLGQLETALKTHQNPLVHTDFQYEMVLPDVPRILCVGVNFPNRNAEYKDGSDQPTYMSLFPRFASGFTGHGQNLVRPPENQTLDYEGEVAVVIGKGGRRISREAAYGHISALTLCNEGTIRDWVRHAKFNVTQGKNWDKSGAMGPWLVPFTDARQLDEARIVTRVNGEVRQDDYLSRMLFPIRAQIEYISTFMTLKPGDVIVTGTPTGAGARLDPPQYLSPGDRVEIHVEGIGRLENGVEDETC